MAPKAAIPALQTPEAATPRSEALWRWAGNPETPRTPRTPRAPRTPQQPAAPPEEGLDPVRPHSAQRTPRLLFKDTAVEARIAPLGVDVEVQTQEEAAEPALVSPFASAQAMRKSPSAVSEPGFVAFQQCLALVQPDGSSHLTFEESLALLVLLGAHPEEALVTAATLTRWDPTGACVAVRELLASVGKMGLDKDEGGADMAEARCEACLLAWQSLSQDQAEGVKSKHLAHAFQQVTGKKDFAAEVYCCCVEMQLQSLTLPDFVVLMMQPEFLAFLREGGLERLQQLERAQAPPEARLSFLEKFLLLMMPSELREDANADKPHGVHWKQTELFFDEHCLQEVEPATVVKVRRVILLTTVLSGCNSMAFAYAGIVLSGVAALQLGSEESIMFYVLCNAYSLLLTLGEIMVMTIGNTIGAAQLARVAKVAFPRQQPQRRAILSSFLGAALGHSPQVGSIYGIDPLRRASPALIFILTILVTLERSIAGRVVKQLTKQIVRKVLPRLLAKNTQELDLGAYADEAATLLVSLFFGVQGTWAAMKMAAFCCLGATAAVHALCRLVDEHKEAMSDAVKLAAFRAFAVTVAHEVSTGMHANKAFVLQFMKELFLTDSFMEHMQQKFDGEEGLLELPAPQAEAPRQRGVLGKMRAYFSGKEEESELKSLALDDERVFLRSLKHLAAPEQQLVLSILCLALIVDNTVEKVHWLILVQAVRTCRPDLPQPSLAKLGQARTALFNKYLVSPQMLKAVFDGTGRGCVRPFSQEFFLQLSLQLSSCLAACGCRRQSSADPVSPP